MSKIWKQMLSLVLAMVMVFSTVPVQAFATETEPSSESTSATEAPTEEPTEADDGTDVDLPTDTPTEAPTEHTHEYASEVTTEADCTTEGVKIFTCSCGNSYTEAIPATGHTYENGVCACGETEPTEAPEPTEDEAVKAVQAMIDALPTSFNSQDEVDYFWNVTAVELDTAIEAITAEQQEHLDLSRYDAAIDAAAAFVNPEFDDVTTWEASCTWKKLSGAGTETDPIVIGIKDADSVGHADLYAILSDSQVYGKTPAYEKHTLAYGGDFRINTTNRSSIISEWNKDNAATSISSDGEDIISTGDTKYFVWICTEISSSSSIIGTTYEAKYGELKYVKFVTYYELSAQTASGSPEGAGISVSPTTVVKGNSATITVNSVDGYSFEVKDASGKVGDTTSFTYTPTASGTLTVTYTATSTTGTLALTINGNGTVKIGDSTYTAGTHTLSAGEYTVVVTPDANYYVSELKIGDNTVSDYGDNRSKSGSLIVSAGGSNTVSVTFTEQTVNAHDGTVLWNPVLSADGNTVVGEKTLDQRIIEAVLSDGTVPASAWANATVTFLSYEAQTGLASDQWCATNTYYDGTLVDGHKFGDNFESEKTTEKVKITFEGNNIYSSMEVTKTVTLKDSRGGRTVSYTKGGSENDAIAYTTTDGLVVLIKENVTLSGLTWADSHTFTYSALPTNGAKSQITVTMTGDTGDATYLPTTEFKVWVQAPEAVATITFSEREGSNGSGTVNFGGLTTDGTLSGGTYTLTVTPSDLVGTDGSAMYVESVAINGAVLTGGTYDNGVYTVSYTVEGNQTYSVVITYGTRTLVLKDLTNGIALNGYASLADITARRASYQAALTPAAFVDYTNSTNVTENADVDVIMYMSIYPNEVNIENLNAITHATAIDEPPVNKSFRIVCNADEKCVAVSKDNVSVQLTESRVAPTVTLGTMSATSFDTLDEAKTAFEKAIVVKDSVDTDITENATVSVAWADDSASTLPGTLKANVTVTNAGSTWIASAEATELTATVGINKYTVTFDPNGGAWGDSTTNNKTEEVAYNGTPTAPEVPTKQGETFLGWTSGGVTYTKDEGNYNFPAVTGEVTYTASWAGDKNGNGVADANETATVTVSTTGEGTVTLSVPEGNKTNISDPNEGAYTVIFDSTDTTDGAKIVVTATPTDTVATDGSAPYVKINNEIKSSDIITVTDGQTTTVNVVFLSRDITTKETLDPVAINKYTAALSQAQTISGLKTTVLNAAGITVNLDQYIVTTSAGSFTVVVSDTGATGSSTGFDMSAALALAMSNDSSRSFTISLAETADGLPAVSKTVTMTIKDSRVAPTVTHTYPDEGQTSYTMDAIDDLAALVKANIKVSVGETEYENATVTVDTTGATLPGEGQSADVTVKVSVTGTADYLGVTDKEITVKVTNKQHLTKLTITLPAAGYTATIKDASGNSVENGTEVLAGLYTITVDPDTVNGYYAVYNVSTSGFFESSASTWENCSYKHTIQVWNDATEDRSVDVTVSKAQRKIVSKQGTDHTYQVKLEDGMTLDALKKAIYEAVVDTTTSSYAPAETLSYEITGVGEVKEGEYQVTITYPGVVSATSTTTIQYPYVSGTFTVKVSPDKTDVVIPTMDTVTIKAEMTEAAAAVKTAILAQNTGLTADDVTVTVAENEVLVKQGATDTYTVNIAINATSKTKAYEGTMNVSVIGEVMAPKVVVNAAENGAVVHNDGEINGNRVIYTFTLTPSVDYYIESLSVAYDSTKANAPINDKETGNGSADASANTVATWQYAHANGYFNDNQTVVHVFDGTGFDLGVVPTYTFTAKFVDPAITIPETGTMTYYYGMGKDTENLESKVMDALKGQINYSPDTLEAAETDILYKAREAATYTYTVTINPADFGIPFIPSQTVDIPIVAGELWVQIGTEFDIGTEPTNDDIQAVVDELTTKYSIMDLVDMFVNDQDALKALIETELKNNQAFVNFYTNYGAHYFGDQETETVKLVINKNEYYGDVESNTCVLTLKDDREETSITANSVEITYGFTEAELLTAMGAKVTGSDGNDLGTPKFVTNVVGLGAADEAYTVKLKFDGSEHYKPSETEVTVKVNKAPVDVFVDNRLLHWQEGLTYDMPVGTDPSGVATIKFIAGLDVSGMNYDSGIKGLVGDVQLMLPDSLQTILDSIGLKNGMSMTLSELKGYLDKVGGLFAGTEYEEVVNVLLNMLNSLPTDTADIRVTIGGALPTNVGVYLVGAVSADGNYETDFGVGAIVIYPNGKKAELDWIVKDDNSIISRSLLTGEPPIYDMGAEVTKVYEGTIEAAQSQVVEVFFGVDVDGNIKLETDQAKLNVGAYTEVAMIANWGNELYYAEPLIRAFVVVADSLNVDFVDENSTVNNERLFTFDNEAQDGMENLKVTWKNGEKAGTDVTGYTVKYLYAGAQTNGIPYASETAPAHAGAYTLTAIVTLRDADNMVSAAGVAVGALVIEPAEATINVENVVKEYDGNAVNVADMITVSSAVPNLTPDSTIITAGINTDGSFSENGLTAIEGDVNIDFPKWVDELIAKSDTLKDGMSVADLKAVIARADELVAEIEATAGVELDTSVLTSLNDVLAQLPGTAAVTFKDRSELSYSAVGAYLVVGVVTDSDHYPTMDAGILIIYPKAVKADLAWKYEDSNNIFTMDTLDVISLGADATVEGSFYRDADLLFLGVEAETMKIILVNDQDMLNVGVYTEFAYLLDVDSTTYYAEPIVRPVTVVAGKLDMKFVDASGAENADRLFAFDNQPHGMDGVVVSFTQTGDGHKAGEILLDTTKQVNDGNLTLVYAGVQTNGIPYMSETAPTHAGAYTVTSTYLYRGGESGLVTHAGVAVGALVIEPADAEITVTDVYHKYDGNAIAVKDMISVTHNVEGINPDTTIITAGLATDGSFSENGLSAINTDVNIDFPKWVDEIIAETDILKDGMSVADLTAVIDKVDAAVSEYEIEGYELEIFDKLKNVLVQLPQNAKLTFKDASQLNYSAVGTYLVVGVVTDSDFYPAIDAGILMIYPDVQKVALDWIYEDSNNIFTKDTLKIVDLGAEIVEKNINAQPKVMFLGVEAETFQIILTDDQSKLNIGVYDEIGYLVLVDSVTYYAEPISRVITVVAGGLDVKFIDETGAENNDRLYTYDGNAHPMETVIVSYKQDVAGREGVLLDTSKQSNDGNLSFYYTGVQTNGIPYASEKAPSHAGTYSVTATYVLRDQESGLVTHVGAAVGVLVIEPAEASITVDEKLHKYDGNAVAIGDMVKITTENGLKPNTTIISAQINTDGTFSEEGLKALTGSVNIDFPKWVDEILNQVGSVYDGIGVSDLIDLIEEADAFVSQYEIEGYELEVFDNLKSVLSQLDQNAKLTFKDTEDLAYSAVGSYLVVGVVTDSNYYPAMDAGVLVIYPNVELGTLEWKNVDKNNIFYLDSLTPGYLDAKALFNGIEDAQVDPAEIYIGVDADNWLIHLSTQQPDSVGIYTEIAVLSDTNSNAHYAMPIIRPVIVVDGIYDVLFHDENGNVNHDRLFTYDGTAKEIGKVYVYGYNKGFYQDAVPTEDELKILYIGTDTTGDGWCREEAPTDAGVYTVIATYTDYENGEVVGGGAGVGTMVIAKADMALDMKDTTVTYDGEGHFVDVTSNAAEPDYLTVIVDKQKNTINFILEDDLTIAGGVVKTLLEKVLDRELDGEFSVTEVQQAIHKIIDEIEAYEIPDEVKAVYDKLPTSVQNAIADLKASTYDPVKAKLDEALALLQNEIPKSGTVIFNGDLPVDVGEYQFYGFALSENYEPEATQGVLTIAPVQIKVTMDDLTKVYGEADPELTYTVKYYDHKGKELTGITADVSVIAGRESGENVGTYAITAEVTVADTNFTIAEVIDGTLTITPKAITVNVEDAAKIYGEEDPTFSAAVNGLVGSDVLNITFERESGEDVGEYAINAFIKDDNYTITVVPGKLTINPKEITAADVKLDGTLTYNGSEQTQSIIVIDGITYEVTDNTGTNAGEYTLTVTGTGNYTGTVELKWTIAKAKVTVTVVSDEITYGDEIPTVELTYSNELAEDELNISMVWNATKDSDVGTYGTNFTWQRYENWDVEHVGGELTIKPKTITVADVKLDGALTYNGTEQTQKIIVTDGITYEVTGNTGTNAGEYTLTVTGTGNYTGTVELPWTIAKADVKVAVDNVSKVYGEDDPELTATTNGTFGSDVLDVKVSRAEGENAGTYDITATVAENGNYNVTVVAGKLTITPATITIEVKDATKVCGEADPENKAIITVTSGKVNESELNVVVTREAGEAAGEYAYKVAYTESDNYTVTVTAGKLTITEKEDDKTGLYPIPFNPDQDTTGTIAPGATVEIDGVPYILDENCIAWVDHTAAKIATTYKYHVGGNAHETYPTNMYVWYLTIVDKDSDGDYDEYTAERIEELDDFFKYEGTSIRINFSSNGIRFFTSVNADKCEALMNGTLLNGPMAGYQMTRTGTLYKKYTGSDSSITFANGVSSDVYGGKAGNDFRVFSTVGSRNWFTGMLTGLDGDAETLDMDIQSRPFAVLELNGETIVLYGGTVQRSIYYVATQNRDCWATGTVYDNYVESLIATVEEARKKS